MLHSVIGTNFPLSCQKMDQFHYHLPYSSVTNLTELFQLLFLNGTQQLSKSLLVTKQLLSNLTKFPTF
jgi:hypothetical protein